MEGELSLQVDKLLNQSDRIESEYRIAADAFDHLKRARSLSVSGSDSEYRIAMDYLEALVVFYRRLSHAARDTANDAQAVYTSVHRMLEDGETKAKSMLGM